MAYYSAINPYPTFLNQRGVGLNGGAIYIGEVGKDPETFPTPVYWDDGGSIIAAQPLVTIGGYIWNAGSPAEIFAPAEYSIRVRDRFGAQIFYSAHVREPLGAFIAALASSSGGGLVGYSPEASYPEGTVGSKLQHFTMLTDFGADPTGAEFSDDALAAAAAASKFIFISPGRYKFSGKFTHTFSPSATGPTDNKKSFDQLCIWGAGRDVTTLYFPSSDGLEFLCSSFQHIVSLRDFSLTTGQAGGGTTALKITNSFAYFGEFNGCHDIDITIRGDDGYAAVYHWSTYIDLFNASNVVFGKSCNLYGPVLGSTDRSYGTGVRIASSATPGSGTSTEPGWGTGYDLTGIKIRFMGRNVEIGAGVQGFSMGPGTEFLVGYDGVVVQPGVTEVRQINFTGAQISVYGDAFYFASAVPSCTFLGGYIGVASGKNGIVFVTNAGAANGGGSTIVGVTFVPLDVGAGDGVYVGTSFNPIVIEACTFVGLNTGVELAAGSQMVTVGPSNRFVNCTNKVIDSGSNNRIGALVDVPIGRIGYASGSGGSVTQATSKSTPVTINSPAGQIITHNAALAGAAAVQFTVTNSSVKATDTIILVSQNGDYEAKACNVVDGSFDIRLKNDTGGSLSNAVTINYAIVSGANA